MDGLAGKGDQRNSRWIYWNRVPVSLLLSLARILFCSRQVAGKYSGVKHEWRTSSRLEAANRTDAACSEFRLGVWLRRKHSWALSMKVQSRCNELMQPFCNRGRSITHSGGLCRPEEGTYEKGMLHK